LDIQPASCRITRLTVASESTVEALTKRIAQMRDGAGHEVPLAMFGTPQDPDYWRAAEGLGFGHLALLLPTRPLDESLRLLDEYSALVDRYRG
jgi:hypothetical protein